MDMAGLAVEMNRLALRIPEATDQLTREVAVACLAQVAASTPYDEGTAISNWQIGIDDPNVPVREAFVFKGGAASNIANAVGDAVGRAGAFSGLRNKTIYVANSLPYIDALNRGHSEQAPPNFVGLGIQAGLAAVRGKRFL